MSSKEYFRKEALHNTRESKIIDDENFLEFINEKTKKERNSPLLFLGIYNKEEKISDARFGTPAYCIETTVKTGRIFKINELCRKEKWVLFSLSLSGHGI